MRYLGGLKAFLVLMVMLVISPAMASSSSGGSPTTEALSEGVRALAKHCCEDADEFHFYLQRVVELPWTLLPAEEVEAVYGDNNHFSHYVIQRLVDDEYTESSDYYALAYDTSEAHKDAQTKLFFLALARLDAAQVDVDDEVTALAGHLRLLAEGKGDLDFSQRIEVFKQRMTRLDDEASLALLHRLFEPEEINRVAAFVPSVLQLQSRGGAQ